MSSRLKSRRHLDRSTQMKIKQNGNRRFKSAVLLATGILLANLITLGGGLNEKFFPIDDGGLIPIPQIELPLNVNGLVSIATPGNHVDFYPLRDLSYYFDVHVLGGDLSGQDGSVYRIVNIVLFSFLVGVLVWILETWVGIYIATGSVGLWAMHPIHAELMMWPAARKDGLAILLGAVAIAFFLTATERKGWRFPLLSLTVWILSLLCKSSLAFLPQVALVAFWLWPTLRKNRSLWSANLLAIAISFVYGPFQSWFYSNVNDMRLFYSWDYRLRASITALGRMVSGWIIPSVNAVDVENWGTWADLNQSFFWVGIFVWLILLLILFHAIQTRNKIKILSIVAFFVFYFPVAGLLFPHRNFYSVRYFEAPALAWLPLAAITLRRLPHSLVKPIFWVTAALLLLATDNKSKDFSSNLAAIKKARAITPTNPALMSLERTELLNLKREEKLDLSGTERLRILENGLQKYCDDDIIHPGRNGDLCWTYWGIAQWMEGRSVSRPTSKHFAASLDSFQLLNDKLYERITTPAGELPRRNFQPTVLTRRRHWQVTCREFGPEAGLALVESYLDRHLLTLTGWEKRVLDPDWNRQHCRRR